MPDGMTTAQLASALCDPHNEPPAAIDWQSLLDDAEAHGVLPLLAGAANTAAWDPALLAMLRPTVAAHAATSMIREGELRTILDALAARGVRPVLFKGAHLAFAIYPSPDRRPHVDVDMLLERDDRHALDRCLRECGYELVPQVTGEVAFGQQQYWKVDPSGVGHTIDVHWRIANPLAFSNRITYSDLDREAMPVPRLGANARGPSIPLALLIACLHRTAHHGNSERLIWLYDIHLLASALDDIGWQSLMDLSSRRGLSAVVAAGLHRATEYFRTDVPSSVIERLHADRTNDEDVLDFLEGPRPRFDVAKSDWRRIPRWRDRSRFLREHLFPPASYIAQRYGTTSQIALPFLYGHRIVVGASKWALEWWRASIANRQSPISSRQSPIANRK
jgi:Uncharacterised nucleotidyltransferase